MTENAPPPRRRTALPEATQRKIVLNAAAAIALLLAGVWATERFISSRAAGVAGPEELPGTFRPTPEQWTGIKTAKVRETAFPSLVSTDGKIAFNDDTTTPVFSPFSGRVTRLIASAGDPVTKGSPLFEIAASEFAQAENDLVAAAAALRTARAQLQLAQTSEHRQKALFEAKGGALKDWQQSQVDLANAEGGLRSAEVALAAVHNRLRILGRTDTDIAALESSSDPQRMPRTAIVAAPVAGVVTQRQVALGQNITSVANGASSPVYAIADPRTVWLVANVRETDAPALRVGDPVAGRVVAFPGRVFRARLIYVAAALDPTLHRLPVRAKIDNADGALKPEMFAQFDIVTGPPRSSPGVPEDAVVYEGDTAHVWVVTPDRTIGLRNIRVGSIQAGMAEVLAGLTAGETIVSTGSLFIDRAVKTD